MFTIADCGDWAFFWLRDLRAAIIAPMGLGKYIDLHKLRPRHNWKRNYAIILALCAVALVPLFYRQHLHQRAFEEARARAEEPRTRRAWTEIERRNAEDAYTYGYYDRAFPLVKALAEKGHAGAQYRLGEMYYSGRGVRMNYCDATGWYDVAARQGHPGAQWSLSHAYQWGHGVYEDDRKAYLWRLASVENRSEPSPDAQEQLALLGEDLGEQGVAKIEAGMKNWRPEDEPPAEIIRRPWFPLLDGLWTSFVGVKTCHPWW